MRSSVFVSLILLYLAPAGLVLLPWHSTELYDLRAEASIGGDEGSQLVHLRFQSPVAGVPFGRRDVALLKDGVICGERTESSDAITDDNKRFLLPAWGTNETEIILRNPVSDPKTPEKYQLRVEYYYGLFSQLSFPSRFLVYSYYFFLITGLMLVAGTLRTNCATSGRMLVAAAILFVSLRVMLGIPLTCTFSEGTVVSEQTPNYYLLRTPWFFLQGHTSEITAAFSDDRSLDFVPWSFWNQEISTRFDTFSVSRGRPCAIRMHLERRPSSMVAVNFPLLTRPFRDLCGAILTLTTFLCWYIRSLKPARLPVDQHIDWPKTRLATSLGMAIISLGRIWLVLEEDVLAMTTMAESYVDHSLNLSQSPPVHPPGISVLAAILRELSVPWRYAVELMTLLCGWCAASFVLRNTKSDILTLLVFSGCVLHTHSLDLSRCFWSEAISLPLNTLTCTHIAILLSKDISTAPKRDLFALGLLLALLNFFRPELPLVIANYLLFLCCAVLFNPNRRLFLKPQCLCQFCLPLVLLFIANQVAKSVNYAQYGLYATDQMHSPGLLRLLKTLHGIDSQEVHLHAPITRATLERACDVSPTLNRFRSQLLDPNNPEAINGEKKVGKRGEFGPHILWLLLVEFSRVNEGESDLARSTASHEVERAIEAGLLPSRKIPFPINPYPRLWVPALVDRFAQNLTIPLEQKHSPPPVLDGDDDRFLAAKFDKALTRTAISNADSTAILELENRYPDATTLTLANENGKELARTRTKTGERVRFLFEYRTDMKPKKLLITDATGTIIEEDVDTRQALQLPRDKEQCSAKAWLRAQLRSNGFLWIPLILFASSTIVLTTTAPLSASGDGGKPLLSICVFTLGSWLGRSFFYALIFAWLGWGPTRYMETIFPGLLIAAAVFPFYLKRRQKMARPETQAV